MNHFFDDFSSLSRDLEKVREVILSHISDSSSSIREGLEEIIRAQGKMLRPAFLILAARLGKFQENRIYDIAAAMEMLHIATLIHDDVIDDADTRRGVPAVHTRMGIRKAILMGDYLFSRSFSLAAVYATIENGRDLSHAVGFICNSEIDQSSGYFSLEMSRRSYLRRIAGKTAALFLLAFHAGASEGRLNKRQIMWARRAGYNIGMAFQITDDILDCTGSSDTLGKPAGNDLRQGIFTLPIILACEKDKGGSLKKLLAAPPYDDESTMRILRLTEESGGLQEARQCANLYTDRAMRAIANLPESASKNELIILCNKVLHRFY